MIPKRKKYTVTLNECEMRRLTVYAAESGMDRPEALMKLLRQSLRQVSAASGVHVADENQLRLFDSVQIDIFNNAVKTKNDD